MIKWMKFSLSFGGVIEEKFIVNNLEKRDQGKNKWGCGGEIL